uniref:Uncharacterized protein n=1 Tax=Megaselia scalaris TaxID=36166 RepID=T1GSN3_MEGSC
MQQSTQNRGQQRALTTELDDEPRLIAAVLRAHMETCEFTKEKVASMRQRARECPSYSMPTLLLKETTPDRLAAVWCGAAQSTPQHYRTSELGKKN